MTGIYVVALNGTLQHKVELNSAVAMVAETKRFLKDTEHLVVVQPDIEDPLSGGLMPLLG